MAKKERLLVEITLEWATGQVDSWIASMPFDRRFKHQHLRTMEKITQAQFKRFPFARTVTVKRKEEHEKTT